MTSAPERGARSGFRAINIGALSGFAAAMVDGLASFTIRHNAPSRVFWIVVALILSLDLWQRRQERLERQRVATASLTGSS